MEQLPYSTLVPDEVAHIDCKETTTLDTYCCIFRSPEVDATKTLEIAKKYHISSHLNYRAG